MRNKAELYVMMGKEQEAFKQFANVYAYVKSVFNKNYPKEIDRLCTRFQADRLKFMNEHRRTLSNRYYVTGIAVCVLVLFYLIFLSWKKIFKLKESKRKQEEMRRKAENAIRKKNMFLSNMSHEVRTPLNAIVGFSTLLASEEDMGMDDDSRKQACEIIRVNSHQLLKLINDILDLSDFEEDNIHFNIKEHDAVKICNEVIETIRASYKLNVRLEFETALASLKLETDDSRLRQVLINLLVNAVKFTKEGSVVLKLEKTNDGTALFSVADTGCGIPKEKQKLIFERFEKLNEFVQGTGLGLSICRLIVTFVGGKIWIDGDYTRGARFCFTHPLKYISTLLKAEYHYMKKIITLVSCLISFSCLFSRGWKGDDTIAFRDSLMRKVEHLPADTSRLSVLLDAAYLHQNPPYNVFFAKCLYEEARKQQNI